MDDLVQPGAGREKKSGEAGEEMIEPCDRSSRGECIDIATEVAYPESAEA
jgi:hypothetical protein